MRESSQNQKILQAITAIKAGDKKRGRELIAEILKADRNNEQAWLWLVQTDISHEQKIKSLQNVLKINPDNQSAKDDLDKFLRTMSQPKKQRKSSSRFLWYIVASLFLICACLRIFLPASPTISTLPTPTGPTPIPQPTPLQHRAAIARIRCEEFVKERLTVPLSADFSYQQAFSVKDKPLNYHVVTGIVDSQNLLGVVLRSNYRCKLHYIPENPSQWVLDNLEID